MQTQATGACGQRQGEEREGAGWWCCVYMCVREKWYTQRERERERERERQIVLKKRKKDFELRLIVRGATMKKKHEARTHIGPDKTIFF